MDGTTKHLVIGLGEVGKALTQVLDCAGIDQEEHEGRYDFIHIAFPYSDNFKKEVKKYESEHLVDNGITVIHSTVPLGTSEELGAVHSPIRGVHPDLAPSIRTFVKYFGGERAPEAAYPFAELGIPVKVVDSSRETEALKLWSTTQYGLNIIIQKHIKEYCDENGLDFDTVYTHANQTYNKGYERMGRSEFKKYVLKDYPGKIGGHCILPNAEILDNELAQWLLTQNNHIKD